MKKTLSPIPKLRIPPLCNRGVSQKRMTSSSQLARPAPSPFVLRSRHPDFKKVEASRKDYDPSLPITFTKSPNPGWKYGEGSKERSNLDLQHHEIDPFEKPMISNYKLLVSAIPRPISLVSTVSKTGLRNLAPMSYFQIVDHDPATFVIGFSARPAQLKDTQRNLEETGECVISVVSDHMVEAMNATSLDVPHGTSEWELSGFHPVPSSTVEPERIKEAIFSVEGKLLEMKSLDYHGVGRRQGKPTGALAIIEATRFWVRKDALNESMDEVALSAMRPVVGLGGISYGRVREVFEVLRPALANELADEEKGLAKFL